MNKGGVGVGSASIILVFAVLCLTVFSLITYVVAGNDKALVDAEAGLVKGYYDADALAERVLAEIGEIIYNGHYDIDRLGEQVLLRIPETEVPDSIGSLEIDTGRDIESGIDTVRYTCTVSEKKALVVRLAIDGGSCDILSWKMMDTDEWEFDDTLDVWLGD